MKLIYINIIVLFCLLSCQKNVKKKTPNNNVNAQTIIDTANQTEEIANAESKMLKYLSSNFQKLSDSTLIKKPKWMLNETTKDIYCGYIFNYAEGHTFKHEQECVEWGEIVTVEFKGHSIEQVHDIVKELYENDNYGWYNNKTEYRPKESYETVWTFRLKENNKGTELSFAYSWI